MTTILRGRRRETPRGARGLWAAGRSSYVRTVQSARTCIRTYVRTYVPGDVLPLREVELEGGVVALEAADAPVEQARRVLAAEDNALHGVSDAQENFGEVVVLAVEDGALLLEGVGRVMLEAALLQRRKAGSAKVKIFTSVAGKSLPGDAVHAATVAEFIVDNFCCC